MSDGRITVGEYIALRGLQTDWAFASELYKAAVLCEERAGLHPRFREERRWDGRSVTGNRVFEVETLDKARREKETRDDGQKRD